MEKQIITFSANEQRLIKTGGIECYASNIVSYIEAHFDLGANWSGYDSVRAVWSNDNNMTVISTVLDSNGVCVVPFEVLKTKGIIKVNLVGSISVSDVLTDRLTTFPCEAVKVTAKAKTDGSETQPITPSQFEQFVAAVISEVEKVTGMTAQAETLPAGSQATARYENGILYLGIPQGIQGERGETGADGNGIASVVYNADYTLTLVFDNGERFTTPPIRGERGPAGADGRDGTDGRDGADGVTPSLSVGTVTTLPSTEDAYVTRTGTDENPIFDFGIPKGDPGEVTMSQLSALLPIDTASGSIASFPDGTDLFPALSVKAEIEPIQDLHGYDKPWSGGAGKNILPITLSDGTTSGLNYTVLKDNGSNVLGINLQGTPTANVVEIEVGSVTLTEDVGYKINGCSYPNSDLRIQLKKRGSSTALAQIYNGRDAEYTPTETAEFFITFVVVLNGQNVNQTIYPMIRLATVTDNTYEPYSNICPISGHTECVTEVCGVNVWDEEWEVYGSSQIKSKNLIPLIPNTTYYLKAPAGIGATLYFKEDTDIPSSSNWSGVNEAFTVPSNIHYAILYAGVGYGTTYKNDICINYPSTDHDYHAYNGTTHATTLGRTVYGGTLDVVSGELVVDRAITEISEEWSWYRSSSYQGGYYADRQTSLGYKPYCLLASSHAKGTQNISEYVMGTCYCDYSINFRIMRETSTLQEWKDYIVAQRNNGTPITVCYELATPQTYQLDPQTIDLLLGQNNVWTDCGSVEVTYKADVGLYIDKKLSSNGTRSLSMGLTKSATAEAETETEPSRTEVETKAEETKTEPSKTETETR